MLAEGSGGVGRVRAGDAGRGGPAPPMGQEKSAQVVVSSCSSPFPTCFFGCM